MTGYAKILGVAALTLWSSGAVNAGEKYSGAWDGRTYTSIEITSTKPLTVTYCYQRQCAMHQPRGTVSNMTFTFPKRGQFAGATMTMQKSGERYVGRYKRNDSTRISTATLGR